MRRLAPGQITRVLIGGPHLPQPQVLAEVDDAVTALREAGSSDPVQALAAAEDAAIKGARDTAESTAKRGRASYVGDAAKGVINPGAAAMALVIGAARAAAAGEKDVDTSWIS